MVLKSYDVLHLVGSQRCFPHRLRPPGWGTMADWNFGGKVDKSHSTASLEAV